jgi:predicted transcriptional regulator YdeE
MKIIHQTQAIHVIGLELRTSNQVAAQSIPAFWECFMAQGVLQRLPNKMSDDIWAVYTHFEQAGVNNEGLYSLIIGAQMPVDSEVPAGLVRAVLPASHKAVFEAQTGRPDSVPDVWQTIWANHDLKKTFIADAERYASSGEIQIWVGVESTRAS